MARSMFTVQVFQTPSPSPQCVRCSLLHCFSAFRWRINIWYNFWPEKNWAEKTGNFWRIGVPSVLANAAFSAPLQYLHIPHHLLWHKWRDANCSKAKISQELEEIQLCNILKHLLHNAPCPLQSDLKNLQNRKSGLVPGKAWTRRDRGTKAR